MPRPPSDRVAPRRKSTWPPTPESPADKEAAILEMTAQFWNGQHFRVFCVELHHLNFPVVARMLPESRQ
jgi:hypothetical protein